MSGEATTEEAGLGVLATWRQTSTQVRALLAGVFVSRLASFIQIFLVLFLKERGFSGTQVAVAAGVYGAGLVLGSFVGGSLSDRLSPRAATLISMAGSAVLIVSILYLKVYVLLLLALLLVSTMGQLYRPAAQAMITELTPKNQLIMVMAMYRLVLNLGTTATPIIGYALVTVSYDLLFWAEAIAALAYGLIALRFLPGRSEAAKAAAGAEDAPKGGYRAVFTDWRYVFFLASVLLIAAVYSQYLASLPLAVRDAGLNTWWYIAVVSLNAVIVATVEVPATRYVQNWPLRVTAIAGWGLVAFGYGMYAIEMVPLFLILGTILWTASEICGAPTTFAYPGIIAPPHLRGRYAGAMLSVFGLANALGPFVGIWLYTTVGQDVWWYAAGAAIAATICARIGMVQPGSTAGAKTSAAQPEPTAGAESAVPAEPATPAASG